MAISLDQKRDLIDGKGDIPDIIEKFRTRQESVQSICVPAGTIKNNDYILSISSYKKFEQEEAKYEKPLPLIKDILALEKDITEELSRLREAIENQPEIFGDAP